MGTYITDRKFWLGVLERAFKTFAQSLIAAFGVGLTLLNADWVGILAVAGTATLLSVLTSIATPDTVLKERVEVCDVNHESLDTGSSLEHPQDLI